MSVVSIRQNEQELIKRGSMNNEAWRATNERMILEQIVARGLDDRRVLEAFRQTPRHLFVPADLQKQAYDDGPLPLGLGQTISQPYIVARMTELLGLRGDESVLEIGTGSGYQTAILARLVRIVYSAELEPGLMRGVSGRLAQLGITNVVLKQGSGLSVFRDEAPFDAILSAAAPVSVPPELTAQLAEGGRAIIPVGAEWQSLLLVERRENKIITRSLDPVQFVPLRHTPRSV